VVRRTSPDEDKKRRWGRPPQTIAELKALAASLNVCVEAMEDVSVLSEPVEAGGLVMPNSLAIHPMEGQDGDELGAPGELTYRRYERFGAGGAGLIWAEAISVVPEGRANPRQLWLHKDNVGSFADLVKRTKESARLSESGHEPVVVAQLTHSGRYSSPDGVRRPLMCRRSTRGDDFEQMGEGKARREVSENGQVVTDEYLDRLVDTYVEAGGLAFAAGFDAVDVKSCHGYLVSELLACYDRKGKYGGSFENRVRFLVDVIDRIGVELGKDKAVVTRLGVYDAVPYPFGWCVDRHDYRKADLTEAKKLIGLLLERGVRLINISIANPHTRPHYGRPYNRPAAGGYEQPEHPLAGVVRLIDLAGRVQKEFDDLVVVGTGYSWLGALMANVAAASKAKGLAKIIGVGRMAFAYPDFARDIVFRGRLDRGKVCVACSRCSQIMLDGGQVGCVVRDGEVYRPIYHRLQKG